MLIDVLPPLIPSVRPESSNLFEVLFTALCFDTAVIHNALIGYATRALLRSPADVPARQHDDLAAQVPPAPAGPADGASFPASWFQARVVLALRALAGEVAREVAHEFFDMTSVRVFRELPEARRALRIQQVALTLKELALT